MGQKLDSLTRRNASHESSNWMKLTALITAEFLCHAHIRFSDFTFLNNKMLLKVTCDHLKQLLGISLPRHPSILLLKLPNRRKRHIPALPLLLILIPIIPGVLRRIHLVTVASVVNREELSAVLEEEFQFVLLDPSCSSGHFHEGAQEFLEVGRVFCSLLLVDFDEALIVRGMGGEIWKGSC